MSNENLYPPPLDRLMGMGALFTTWGRAEDERDYVAEMALTAEHVPGLIRIARRWIETYHEEQPDERELWAPIHAWRALGQLGAVEAVEPLLGMMDGLAETDDDWHMEEFPKVMGMIGSDAVEPLRRYILDPSHGIYSRSVAGSSLVRIAERHPHSRAAAVSAVAAALVAYEENDTSLNAFFVGHLLRLKAVEQAELIERAFAAERVDDGICGFWGEVREDLGIEGLGLAVDRPRAGYHEGSFSAAPPEHIQKKERIRQRNRKLKLKAKQKQRKKARKKNRKAK